MPGLVGAQIHLHRLRSSELEEILRKRFGLTVREIRMAQKIAHGTTNDELAEEFEMTAANARARRASLFAKLKVRNRAQLAALFVELAGPADLT
jgi:DNA-binding CsgD family transcriptional regulator